MFLGVDFLGGFKSIIVWVVKCFFNGDIVLGDLIG